MSYLCYFLMDKLAVICESALSIIKAFGKSTLLFEAKQVTPLNIKMGARLR